MIYPKPLPHDEQTDLCAKAQAGDIEARNRLTWHTMRFVVKRAGQMGYQNPAHVEDLVNDGVIGLFTAIEKFDPTKGVKFITYAKWWVDAEIREGRSRTQGLRKKHTDKYGYLTDYRAAVEAGQSHEEAIASVAAARRATTRAVEHVVWVLTLPTPAPIEGWVTNTVPAEDEDAATTVERSELAAEVQAAVARVRRTLGRNDQLVLDRRILPTDERETLEQVGAAVNFTREWARLREKVVVEKLRAALTGVER